MQSGALGGRGAKHMLAYGSAGQAGVAEPCTFPGFSVKAGMAKPYFAVNNADPAAYRPCRIRPGRMEETL